MRTFAALCLSVGTTRRIAEAVEREASRLTSGLGGAGWKLAWVPPANLHVTLKFVGDIPPENVDAIAVTLRRRVSALPPITLKIGGYGAFPKAPNSDVAPRVLWIGVDGGAALISLQKNVESDLFELGFPKETLPYHPHITIARVVECPDGAIASQEAIDLGEDRVEEVVIYESKLHRAGAEYIARARLPFSKPGKPDK